MLSFFDTLFLNQFLLESLFTVLFGGVIIMKGCSFFIRAFSNLQQVTIYLNTFTTIFSGLALILLIQQYTNYFQKILPLQHLNQLDGIASISHNYFSNYYLFYKNSTIIDQFGLILFIISIIVGFISRLALESRFRINAFHSNFYLIYFNFIILLFITTNSILEFFFLYECLLLPSFFIVYYLSYSQRSIQAAIYFLIWTQFGSILVLIAIALLISTFNVWTFTDISIVVFSLDISDIIKNIILVCLFIGFGAKVPIVVFQYWITKTHVEAPGGFSIYLSGFLVKTAIFGLFKFGLVTAFLSNINSLNIIYFILLLGVIDSSLKFWFQTDIKKLVAYCTIQEMNIIMLLMFGSSTVELHNLTLVFVFSHALLSALLFYLVDLIYYRWLTRNTNLLTGILISTPILGNSILAMKLIFLGIPGTLKFIIEFLFINYFIDHMLYLVLIFILVNVFAALGFVKIWLNTLFGVPQGGFQRKTRLILDLTAKEIVIVLFLLLIQIIPSFFLFNIL